MSRHTLSVLVQDQPGVLARVAGLFSRRGFNIESLVKADAETRSHILETVQLFRAKVVDVANDAVTIEATGKHEKLEALLRVLEPYGIKELVKSGLVAMGRGPRSITDRSVRSLDRTG